MEWTSQYIKKRQNLNLYRSLKTVDILDSKNFGSNDYLALSKHPEVVKEFANTKRAGSCSSRLISGNYQEYEILEAKLASYLNFESCLYYSSGFMANLGLVTALVRRNDIVISDKFIHASLIEAIKLSGAKNYRFQHNNLNHCEHFLKKIQRKENQNIFIVLESLYSMQGDSPDFEQILELLKKYNVYLIVDEAHALGAYGAGISPDTLRKGNDKVFMTATASKALGTYGGIVAGPKWLKDFLINSSKNIVYNTALPLGVIKASIKAVEILEANPELGKKLISNANYFAKKVGSDSTSHIVPVKYSEGYAEKLKREGFYLPKILPPTVPGVIFRASITLHHSKKELDNLVELLK